MKSRSVKSIIVYLIFGFPISFLSCTNDENPKDSFDVSFFDVKSEHVESVYNHCTAGKDDCTYMSFDYPVFKNLGKSEVLKKIQLKVNSFLLEGEQTNSFRQVTERFIKEYDEFIHDPELEQDDYSIPWYDSRKAEWITIRPNVVSIKISLSAYMGGAHPGSGIYLRNFIPSTGDSLGLGMVFGDEAIKELTEIGEMEFNKKYPLAEGESYDQAGYWFKDDVFLLTPNFAFTSEGLWFYYNEYEIASYATGPQEILIPYEKIKHLFSYTH